MCSHQPAFAPIKSVIATGNPGAGLSSVSAQIPENPVLGAKPSRRTSARAKLWDLPEQYHCPVIGTCLHVDELRAIADKAGFTADHELSDYSVHVSFVSVAEERRHPIAIGTQKLLEKKHAIAVRKFSRAKDANQLLELWSDAVAAGRIPGAFWALMTHSKADNEVRKVAYEAIHMLSHQVGAGLITDARLLADTRAELRRVRVENAKELQRTRDALAKRDRQIASLRNSLAETRDQARELDQARQRTADLESGEELAQLSQTVRLLKAEVEDLRHSETKARAQAETWSRRLEETQAALGQSVVELEESRGAIQVLERLVIDDTGSDSGCTICPVNGESGGCGACLDLAGRRVLCVGGRSSLARHYRRLVDRCNGELVHHDGGLEDSRQRLETLLSAADVVVCPADCVSHDAYLKAKRHCKRTAKPCVLLKSSGVASFAWALEQVAA